MVWCIMSSQVACGTSLPSYLNRHQKTLTGCGMSYFHANVSFCYFYEIKSLLYLKRTKPIPTKANGSAKVGIVLRTQSCYLIYCFYIQCMQMYGPRIQLERNFKVTITFDELHAILHSRPLTILSPSKAWHAAEFSSPQAYLRLFL